ncbi:MAG: D-2-hydroxyacid dehydrogenase [Bacteroidia bacterium]
MQVFIHQPIDPTVRDFLELRFPNIHFALGQDMAAGAREDAFLKSEVVFGNIPAAWVQKSENLRWVQLASAGVNQYIGLNWDDLSPKVTMTNLAGFFGISVAETALGGILSIYRRLDHLARLQSTHTWRGKEEREQVRTLWQKKVIIMGPGSIGLHLKRLLLAFECEITLFGRRKENSDITTAEELDRAIPGADIVVAVLPETAETVNFLHRERLSLLSDEAILVSIGRGTVLDEQALAAMLHNHLLLGAVVDVTVEEPLPESHPFWDCPRILLTQHTSGGFESEVAAFARLFADNLERYLAGKPLVNVVNWKKGY